MGFVRKSLAILLFAPLLVVLPVVFVLQLILAAPFLILAHFATTQKKQNFGAGDESRQPKVTGYQPRSIKFDRLKDVSKLRGCNTRNVNYRWELFAEELSRAKAAATVAEALDFGAGSMRDSYELASVGFKVCSCDLNFAAMNEGLRYFDWSATSGAPSIVDFNSLANEKNRFSAITAFDVIEHLHEPEPILASFRNMLAPSGVLLVSVPNRMTLMERVFRRQHIARLKKGIVDSSGVPHVQFRTPGEWGDYFSAAGFRIVRHEMGIGFFVNDVWHAFYAIPIRFAIEPIIARVAHMLGLKHVPNRFEKLFYPAWLMRWVDRLDQYTAAKLKHRWAWNLFVLQRA